MERIVSSTVKASQYERDMKTRDAIFKTFKSGDDISISLIQRRCAVGYFTASRVFKNLIEDGLIELGKGNGISKLAPYITF